MSMLGRMPTFLTTHTGSLPRPTDLTQLLHDREDRKPTPNIEQRISEAVKEAVRRQVEAGVDVVNDGEMGKIGYSTYVTDRLTGFDLAVEPTRRPPIDLVEFPDLDTVRRPTSPALRYAFSAVCSGAIKPKNLQAVQNDIATLKAAGAAAGTDRLFMSAASPGVVAFFIPDQHYGNYEAYLAAIAEAMRPEYRAIVEAGITLQLDCPDLAMAGARFPSVAEFRRFAASNVEALNHALDGLPPEHLRVHICWGNYEGPHTHDVELKDIIDIVLSAHAAGLSLEACNPRHAHEWRVFEDVKLPDDRYLLPGVIDSTNNFVEHPDLVAERLLNYGRLVGGERVMATSDCGFGTFAGVSNVASSVVWAKFKSMAEGARRATERLRTPAGVR
jgi:5-methyltetrahydropteroyltriglutamate--homocysteine methyltransferase